MVSKTNAKYRYSSIKYILEKTLKTESLTNCHGMIHHKTRGEKHVNSTSAVTYLYLSVIHLN